MEVGTSLRAPQECFTVRGAPERTGSVCRAVKARDHDDMSVSDRWTYLLRESGYEHGAELGSGMEGKVVSLGDDLAAKIWHRRGATEPGTDECRGGILDGGRRSVSSMAPDETQTASNVQ